MLSSDDRIIECPVNFEILSISSVFFLTDLQCLERQATEGAYMGFTGKQVIHPNQIPVVQKAFSPSPEKIEWARELIKAFHEHHEEGKVRAK